MKIIKLKNNQETPDTYCGQVIAAGEYYTITSEHELEDFRRDDKVNTDIRSNPVKLIINDGSEDLTPPLGSDWLQGNYIEVTPTVPKNDHSTYGRKWSESFTPASANEEVEILDYLVDSDTHDSLHIWGSKFKVNTYHEDDYITMQVVDIDGVGVDHGWYDQATFDAIGPVVLKEYAEWYLGVEDGAIVCSRPPASSPGRVMNGLYIRVRYHTYSNTARKFWVNWIFTKQDGQEV